MKEGGGGVCGGDGTDQEGAGAQVSAVGGGAASDGFTAAFDVNPFPVPQKQPG